MKEEAEFREVFKDIKFSRRETPSNETIDAYWKLIVQFVVYVGK